MRKTDVTEYVITSDKFNEEFEGYKFALLTDLHANGYGIDLHIGIPRGEEYSGTLHPLFTTLHLLLKRSCTSF